MVITPLTKTTRIILEFAKLLGVMTLWFNVNPPGVRETTWGYYPNQITRTYYPLGYTSNHLGVLPQSIGVLSLE